MANQATSEPKAESQHDLADLHQKHMVLNMGPSHPATHGTTKFVLTLDGETIVDMDVHIGYLHRGFEKMAEAGTWAQVLPYTDRLNYCSPLLNNVGYVMAVEKLLGIQVPERAQYIRVLISELARLTDHLTAIGAGALELGGYTPFLYAIQARENFYFVIEELTGARLTTAYTRIGGLKHDLTPTFEAHYRTQEAECLRLLDEVDKLLTKNRIFYDRMVDVGTVSQETAISHGFTGPVLRSTGVAYDVRKDHPYLVYDRLDFEVPIGHKGDNYDRYLVRMAEIHQSIRIIRQVFKDMPKGPINVDDWGIVLPPKLEVYNSIEAMMAHFKMIMEGVQVPPGEAYSYSEGANGELGFYMISDGSGRPYRLHVRAPCFYLMSGIRKMVQGAMIADLVPTYDTINMIGGEQDR
ncbi:MAG: NADH-quinone oxidoreductase subunit D [Myxococcales bacterium]